MTTTTPTRETTPDWLRDAAAAWPPMMTLAECTAALRCSDRHARRLIAGGTLRAVRGADTGSARVIVPRAEIVKYLAAHEAR